MNLANLKTYVQQVNKRKEPKKIKYLCPAYNFKKKMEINQN